MIGKGGLPRLAASSIVIPALLVMGLAASADPSRRETAGWRTDFTNAGVRSRKFFPVAQRRMAFPRRTASFAFVMKAFHPDAKLLMEIGWIDLAGR